MLLMRMMAGTSVEFGSRLGPCKLSSGAHISFTGRRVFVAPLDRTQFLFLSFFLASSTLASQPTAA